jgi:hypothetical protein
MRVLALIEKHLGLNDFNPAIVDILRDRGKYYHLSFYRVVVNEDKIPKDEYEHIDKKLIRIKKFQRLLEGDVKEFKEFLASADRSNADMEQNLKMATRIYSRMVRAKKEYVNWRLLAKSRALEQECIATYLVNEAGVCSKIPTMPISTRPSFPIDTGVKHYAFNVRPLDCDVQLYSSYQAFKLVGSGHKHQLMYSKGSLMEVSKVQTYMS